MSFRMANLIFLKDSFGSYHLGLESKILYMILKITFFIATELVIELV
jgi:hypothetical protein